MKHTSPKKYRANVKNEKQVKRQELLDDAIVIYKLVRLPEAHI